MLVDVPAGLSQPVPAAGHGRFLILTDGAVIVDGIALEPRSLIEIPAGVDGPLIISVTGARLIVRVAAR